MPATKKKVRLTNEQVVRDIMNYSRYGGLIQAFVMEALSSYSQHWAKANPDDFSKDSFVNMDAWIGCAKEVVEKLKANGYIQEEPENKTGD